MTEAASEAIGDDEDGPQLPLSLHLWICFSPPRRSEHRYKGDHNLEMFSARSKSLSVWLEAG